jgi:hypothetical protein
MVWDMKMLIMAVHFIGVILMCCVILFCEDITLLFVLLITIIFVFVQICVLNGCLVAKIERMMGDESYNLTELIKSALFISKETSTVDVEKVIVGMLLIMTIVKLGVFALPRPFLQKIRYLFLTTEGLQRLYYSYFSQSRYHASP